MCSLTFQEKNKVYSSFDRRTSGRGIFGRTRELRSSFGNAAVLNSALLYNTGRLPCTPWETKDTNHVKYGDMELEKIVPGYPPIRVHYIKELTN